MLYLASQSPRRQALLEQIAIPFKVLSLPASAVLEEPRDGELPAAYVRRMARAKALLGLRQMRLRVLPPSPVLGADTEVVLGHRIFGKPHDRHDAAEMLHALSGQTHLVLSAVALCLPPESTTIRTFDTLVSTQVTFRDLSDTDIARYLDSGEPFGKAGAYAIQGLAGAFVCHLAGSYSGVVGLPLFETAQLLKRHIATVPTAPE